LLRTARQQHITLEVTYYVSIWIICSWQYKMHCFETAAMAQSCTIIDRFQKILRPWNLGQMSLKVTKTGTIHSLPTVFY